MSKRRTQALREPTNALYLESHNAYLVTPGGKRISVNITPEASIAWERWAGCKVEWFATPVRESEAA